MRGYMRLCVRCSLTHKYRRDPLRLPVETVAIPAPGSKCVPWTESSRKKMHEGVICAPDVKALHGTCKGVVYPLISQHGSSE